MRHKTPNEAWAAHVANVFEPVPVDPDGADDLFRPYKICTARRSQVWWNTNDYFHPSLEPCHGEEVMVGCDYPRADKVWVREFDRRSGQPGKLICVAIFGGNRARHVPLTYEQKAVEKRAAGRLRRVEAKRDSIEAERDAMLMIDHQPMQVADFIDLKPAPEPVPVAIAVDNSAAASPVVSDQPRRRVFRPNEELAVWALQNASELTPNQIRVLRDCVKNQTARAVLQMAGIDTEALRTLLCAAA